MREISDHTSRAMQIKFLWLEETKNAAFFLSRGPFSHIVALSYAGFEFNQSVLTLPRSSSWSNYLLYCIWLCWRVDAAAANGGKEFIRGFFWRGNTSCFFSCPSRSSRAFSQWDDHGSCNYFDSWIRVIPALMIWTHWRPKLLPATTKVSLSLLQIQFLRENINVYLSIAGGGGKILDWNAGAQYYGTIDHNFFPLLDQHGINFISETMDTFLSWPWGFTDHIFTYVAYNNSLKWQL